jgi:2-aminoadipate transaminase
VSAARITFGGGLPDPGLRPALIGLVDEVLRDEPDTFSYGGEWGHEGLRDQVAARLNRRSGARLAAGNVVLTNGCAGALELVARTLVEPGAVVVTEALTYPGALAIFRACGARIVPVAVDEHGMDVDALTALVAAERPVLVYTIATNHSPTGSTLSAARRDQLLALADRAGFTVVQDDTYGEIRFTDDTPAPLIGGSSERVVHLGSFSKTLAPGLRLGWIAAPAAVCDAVVVRRTDLGSPLVLQGAVARFLADGHFDEHVRQITAAYRAKRDVLLDALAQHAEGLGTWTVPAGGFFSWFVLAAGDVEQVAPVAAEEGVGFLGGPYFSAGAPAARGLRLAYGELAADQLAEGVRRLVRAIERTAARPGESLTTSRGDR